MLARRHAEEAGRVGELRDAIGAMSARQGPTTADGLRFDGDYLVVSARRSG